MSISIPIYVSDTKEDIINRISVLNNNTVPKSIVYNGKNVSLKDLDVETLKMFNDFTVVENTKEKIESPEILLIKNIDNVNRTFENDVKAVKTLPENLVGLDPGNYLEYEAKFYIKVKAVSADSVLDYFDTSSLVPRISNKRYTKIYLHNSMSVENLDFGEDEFTINVFTGYKRDDIKKGAVVEIYKPGKGWLLGKMNKEAVGNSKSYEVSIFNNPFSDYGREIIKIEKAGKKEQNDIMRTVWIPEYSQCNGTFADENNMMILTLNVSQEPSYFRPTSLKTIVKRLENAFNGKTEEKIDYYNLTGVYYYPNTTFDGYIMRDMILNNNFLKKYITLNEHSIIESDTIKVKYINRYYITFRQRKTLDYKKDNVLRLKQSFGEEFVIVNVRNISNQKMLNEIKVFFGKVFTIYNSCHSEYEKYYGELGAIPLTIDTGKSSSEPDISQLYPDIFYNNYSRTLCSQITDSTCFGPENSCLMTLKKPSTLPQRVGEKKTVSMTIGKNKPVSIDWVARKDGSVMFWDLSTKYPDAMKFPKGVIRYNNEDNEKVVIYPEWYISTSKKKKLKPGIKLYPTMHGHEKIGFPGPQNFLEKYWSRSSRRHVSTLSKVYPPQWPTYLGKKSIVSQRLKFIPCPTTKTSKKNPFGKNYTSYVNDEDFLDEDVQEERVITSKGTEYKDLDWEPFSEDSGGKIPPQLSVFFPYGTSRRIGTDYSPSSFLQCLIMVQNFQKNYQQVSKSKREKRVEGIRKNLVKDSYLCKQELYQLTIPEIKKCINNQNFYLDPQYFVSLLENYFDVNIILFDSESLIIPHHCMGYYREVFDLDKLFVCILIKTETFRTEIICPTNSLYFDYSQKDHKGIIDSIILGYKNKLSFYNPDSVVPLVDFPRKDNIINIGGKNVKIESQIIDQYGKSGTLNLSYNGNSYTFISELRLPVLPNVDVSIKDSHDGDKIKCPFAQHSEYLCYFKIGNTKFTMLKQNKSNNLFASHQINKNYAYYFVQYAIKLYSKSLITEPENFIMENVVVQPNRDYTLNVSEEFTDSCSILQNGKLVVPSEDAKYKILFLLQGYIDRTENIKEEYKNLKYIPNFYLSETVFKKKNNEIVIQNYYKNILKNINFTKNNFTIRNRIDYSEKQSYFVKNNNYSKNICVATNKIVGLKTYYPLPPTIYPSKILKQNSSRNSIQVNTKIENRIVHVLFQDVRASENFVVERLKSYFLEDVIFIDKSSRDNINPNNLNTPYYWIEISENKYLNMLKMQILTKAQYPRYTDIITHLNLNYLQ